MANNGRLKRQGIPGRLKAERDGGQSANDWFRSLWKKHGPLLIEYAIAVAQPVSPALLEAQLLQVFLNQNGSLPTENKAF